MARTLAVRHTQRKGLAYRSTTKGRSARAKSSSVDRCSIRSMTGTSHKAESSIARSYPFETKKVPFAGFFDFKPIVFDHRFDRQPPRLIWQGPLAALETAR